MTPKMLASDAASALNITLQAINKKLKHNHLSYEKSQNRIYFDHNTSKEIFNLKVKPSIFTTQVVKGGTGKTTLVANLAVRLNLYGLKVLCIDLDQQSNLTSYFNVNAENHPVLIDILHDKEKKKNVSILDYKLNLFPGLDILPSRIENAILDNYIMVHSLPLDKTLKDIISPALDEYDVILIDCPPALGQTVATASLASDYVIAPANPERFCIDGLKISFEELENLGNKFHYKPEIKIIVNKFDTRTNLSHEILQGLMKNEVYGDCLFKSFIRYTQEFPNCAAKGISVFDALRPTAALEDIDLWAKEIIKMISINDGGDNANNK
jgi:chromosome partitioning protein